MSSPIHGGRRRRHGAGRLAFLALLVAPLLVGGAAYLALTRDKGSASPPPVALGSPAGGGALPARKPKPPLAELPAPGVRLAGVDAFRLRFRKRPRAAMLFDVDTGEVLWRRKPLQRLPIASLTKIMTALVVVDHTRPRQRVRITRAALRYQGSGVGLLRRGRRVPVETLMHGMLLVSGNDASIALAVAVAGSERRFVRIMNRRAWRLGLRCTHFVTSHGLQRGNQSCPADLAVLARLAMRQPRIRRIVRKRRSNLRFPVKGGRLSLNTTNPLIKLGYRGMIGLKTGFTDEAGRCYLGVARRNGRTLGVVLLHSPDPPKQAAKLLNKGFRTRTG